MTTSQLTDQAARDRISSDLGRTLFVEAGAGSGKTRALVDRVVALIGAGVAMENIAAITFTEKAAAELRDRIRQRLRSAETREDLGEERAEAALHQLDGAAVGTLHSFAQRILSEHPVEAGLPPSVDVLDDIGSQIEFDVRWRDFLDRLLDEPKMGATLLRLEMLAVRLNQIRALAVRLNQNWDRLEGRFPGESDPLPPVDVGEIGAGLQALAEIKSRCSAGPEDTLYARIEAVERELARLDDSLDDVTQIEVLKSAIEAGKGRGAGRQDNWGDGGQGKANKAAATAALKTLAAPRKPGDSLSICEQILERASQAALEVLVARLAAFTLDAAEQRRAGGRLEFHDLLVRARLLLRHDTHGPAVRTALRERYQRLLIDEFQDTDPIQVELAALLGCDDPDASGARWTELQPDPGRLFFVGDPKQSIYRFRGADIATFLEARDWTDRQESWPYRGPRHQLPLGRTHHRLGQRRVRTNDPAVSGQPTRVRASRRGPGADATGTGRDRPRRGAHRDCGPGLRPGAASPGGRIGGTNSGGDLAGRMGGRRQRANGARNPAGPPGGHRHTDPVPHQPA